MAVNLTVHDETGAGRRVGSFVLEGLNEQVTVREIIRSRIYQEVSDYNQRQPEFFRGLIAPSDAEQSLNGFKLRKTRQLDWEEQFALALEGFGRNRFFILIGQKQAASLDQVFFITPETEVSFVKLVQLVGG